MLTNKDGVLENTTTVEENVLCFFEEKEAFVTSVMEGKVAEDIHQRLTKMSEKKLAKLIGRLEKGIPKLEEKVEKFEGKKQEAAKQALAIAQQELDAAKQELTSRGVKDNDVVKESMEEECAELEKVLEAVAYDSDDKLKEDVKEIGLTSLKQTVYSLEKGLVHAKDALKKLKEKKIDSVNLDDLKGLKKYFATRKAKSHQEEVENVEAYIDFCERAIKICKAEIKHRERSTVKESTEIVEEGVLDRLKSDDKIEEKLAKEKAKLKEIIESPYYDKNDSGAQLAVEAIKEKIAKLEKEKERRANKKSKKEAKTLVESLSEMDDLVFETVFEATFDDAWLAKNCAKMSDEKLAELITALEKQGPMLRDEIRKAKAGEKPNLDELKGLKKFMAKHKIKRMENYQLQLEEALDITTRELKACKAEQKKRQSEKVEESVQTTLESVRELGLDVSMVTEANIQKKTRKMSEKKLEKLIVKLSKQITESEVQKSQSGDPDGEIAEDIQILKAELKVAKQELAHRSKQKGVETNPYKKDKAVTESTVFEDFVSENFIPEEMDSETMGAILECMMRDTLSGEEMEFFLESAVEQSLVEHEGLMEAGGRNIVRLNKQAKLSQARMMAIFSIAREKKDPKFRKLLTLWRMEREIEEYLVNKYGNEGTRRAKAAQRAAKTSKSKTVKKVAEKAKSMFNGDKIKK